MTTTAMPNDDALQLQTAMHNIDALHHTITQSVTTFESLFAEHGQATAGDQRVATPPQQSGALGDALKELNDLSTQLAQELTQTLGAGFQTMHQNTIQAQSATQQHLQDWNQAHDAMTAGLAALEQGTEQSAHAAQTLLGELQTTVDHVAQNTQDLLHQFETASQTIAHTLSDTVSSTLNRAAGEFHDGISGTLNGKVTEHLSSVFQNAEQSLTNLAQGAEQITQSFAHEAEDALQHFSQAVADGLKHEIESAAEHLLKEVVETLSAFVATAIAEATAGSAITSAMSPILPEVIVVKEASEAIKDLIAVFKAIGSLL